MPTLYILLLYHLFFPTHTLLARLQLRLHDTSTYISGAVPTPPAAPTGGPSKLTDGRGELSARARQVQYSAVVVEVV